LGTMSGAVGTLGVVAKWQQSTSMRFAPRRPNGRFMSFSDYGKSPWKSRVAGATQGRNWVPRAGQASNASSWARAGRWAGRASGALTAASGAFDQWTQDTGRSDLDTGDRVVRSTTRALAD